MSTTVAAKKRYLELISGYAGALLYGIYLLLPLRSWIRWSNFTEKPLPYFPYDDSFGYLMHIKNIIRNNGSFGNPYLYENSSGTYDIPDSYILLVWTKLGMLFNFHPIQIYLVMTFITGFVTYLVSLKICKFVGLNNLNSNVVSFIILFLSYSLTIARPSPTSLCLWLLLLGILILSRTISKFNKIDIFKYLIVFCGMIFLNPIYAIFLTTLSFLYLIFFKPIRLYFIKFIIPTEILGLGLIFLTKRGVSEAEIETIKRLGSLKTHFPASAYSSLTIIVLIGCILIIPNVSQISRILMANSVALLIALNSQIISGVWWEFESHYKLIFNYILILTSAHLVKENLAKNQMRVLTFLVLLIFGNFAMNNFIFFSSETKKQSILSEKDITLVKKLSKIEHINDVFLFSRRSPVSDYPEIIFLLNAGFVYWHTTAGQWSLTDEEVLIRYGCTLDYSNFNSQILTEDANKLYIHRFLNADGHFKKWYDLMNLLSLSKKYVSEQEIQLEKDLIFLKKNKNTFCKKYKLDFVVSENKVLLPFDLKASEN
jgi:hypothetical protein